ncbi:Isochorismatase-like protein [Cercophora newfieldiana]|uniref:Isochorismatase-like protein n=1 Tax=Cercophora newfieldiana TaxID=92897 RepID=A0AA39Y4T4_9PEZI|nr:Isochorismatase-like protein [Cercophora newfieldiana]
MANPSPQRRFQNPAVFVCDIQEGFRPAIFEFDKVIKTTIKLLRAASLLSIPTYVTTQNRTRLGNTVAELLPHLQTAVADADKTRFSMWIPSISSHFPPEGPRAQVAIVGIESHICVTQTALDLISAGHRVHIIADAVSSCNREEVPIALARLRAAGAVITTSESWIYECMGDAGIDEFRSMVKLVKETGPDTKASMQGLLGGVSKI